MLPEINPFLEPGADDHVVHRPQRRNQRPLMFIWQRALAALVKPQHRRRSETHREVVAQRPRFAEKLHVASVRRCRSSRRQKLRTIETRYAVRALPRARIYPARAPS